MLFRYKQLKFYREFVMSKYFIVFLFIFQVSANYDQFVKKFNEIVIDDEWDEFVIDHKLLNNHDNEISVILSDLVGGSMYGLEDVNLKVNLSSETLQSNLSDISGYFCYRLVKDYDYSDTKGECSKKLNELLDPLLSDKDIDSFSLVTMVGNYYGIWEVVYVIAHNYELEEAYLLELDIIHEI